MSTASATDLDSLAMKPYLVLAALVCLWLCERPVSNGDIALLVVPLLLLLLVLRIPGWPPARLLLVGGIRTLASAVLLLLVAQASSDPVVQMLLGGLSIVLCFLAITPTNGCERSDV